MDISKVVALFEDVFDNREDVIRTLNRLVNRQLIEVNTRSTENIQGASHVRVTAAGWYYERQLIGTFPYLDLVLQDTPFNDRQVAEQLRDSVKNVDNLYDREEEKIIRLNARFDRVEIFLKYLEEQESSEMAKGASVKAEGVLTDPVVSGPKATYLDQKAWILGRLIENRGFDENFFVLSQQDRELLDSIEAEFYDPSTQTPQENP